jgi:hypothetical protein
MPRVEPPAVFLVAVPGTTPACRLVMRPLAVEWLVRLSPLIEYRIREALVTLR